MMEINKHEEYFELHPVGVKYICEFCNEGEMQVNTDPVSAAYTSMPQMYEHKCNKCGKTYLLPKSYPYVKFMTAAEYSEYMKHKNESEVSNNDST